MISFKQFFFERLLESLRDYDLDGYWIIPKITGTGMVRDDIAKTIRVGFAGHYEYAIRNPLQFKLTTKEIHDIAKKYYGQGVISQCIQNGGIHVSISYNKMRVDINQARRVEIPKIKEELKIIAAKHKIIGPWGISGDSDRLAVLIDTRSYINNLPRTQDIDPDNK